MLVAGTIAAIWYYSAAPPGVRKQITWWCPDKAQAVSAATAKLKDWDEGFPACLGTLSRVILIFNMHMCVGKVWEVWCTAWLCLFSKNGGFPLLDLSFVFGLCVRPYGAQQGGGGRGAESASGISCSQVEILVVQWPITCHAPRCKTTWWFSTAPRCLSQAQLPGMLEVT